MNDAYRRRFQKVLEHIDAHLEDDLSVETLSRVAAFSKYHFHRQFSLLLGIGVFRYVQLVRLCRATQRLSFSTGARILEIAFESGYDSQEAFTRAFKKAVGQTPAEFREQPEWTAWHTTYQPVRALRSMYMKPAYQPDDVKIVDFPETRVAALEHHGDPGTIGSSVRKFIEWRKQNKLPPSSSATFNIFYSDAEDTPAADYRLDICAATSRPIIENATGVVEKTIPAGRCAVLRHVGNDDTLRDAVHFLYSSWLPVSGEDPRDFPLFLQRVRFFPEVPEHETELDVFLPLR